MFIPTLKHLSAFLIFSVAPQSCYSEFDQVLFEIHELQKSAKHEEALALSKTISIDQLDDSRKQKLYVLMYECYWHPDSKQNRLERKRIQEELKKFDNPELIEYLAAREAVSDIEHRDYGGKSPKQIAQEVSEPGFAILVIIAEYQGLIAEEKNDEALSYLYSQFNEIEDTKTRRFILAQISSHYTSQDEWLKSILVYAKYGFRVLF